MKNLTLLEIANRHRDENLYSDILAFFLNPTKPHKLGITVLKALVDAAYENTKEEFDEKEHGSVYISREFPISGDVNKPKGRMDFFIRTKNYVICIENKIDHKLNNPLKIYDEVLEKHAGKDKDGKPIRTIIRIILSAKSIPLAKKDKEVGWKVVTYKAFFEHLEKNDLLLKSSPYFDYFDQFICSITNHSKEKTKKEPQNAYIELAEKSELNGWKQWTDEDSDGFSIVYPFEKSNIEVFAYISENSGGWYVGIQLYGKIERGGVSLELFNLFDNKSHELSNYEYVGNGRAGKQCQKPYSTDNLNEVVNELLRLKKLVEEFLNNKIEK